MDLEKLLEHPKVIKMGVKRKTSELGGEQINIGRFSGYEINYNKDGELKRIFHSNPTGTMYFPTIESLHNYFETGSLDGVNCKGNNYNNE